MSNIEFHNWGDVSVLLTRPVDRTKSVFGAFVWMDWNRRYFIFTGGSMEKGRPYTRTRQSQEDPASDADPNMFELAIPQPITAELYYSACGKLIGTRGAAKKFLTLKKSCVLNIG